MQTGYLDWMLFLDVTISCCRVTPTTRKETSKATLVKSFFFFHSSRSERNFHFTFAQAAAVRRMKVQVTRMLNNTPIMRSKVR